MTTCVLCVLPLEPSHQAKLEQAAAGRCSFIYNQHPSSLDGVDIVIGNVPVSLIKNSAVKLLQLNSAGYEAYTAEGASPKDMHLCNARGAYGLAVSEHMLALTFDLIRHLALYRDKQRAHDWSDCGKITSIEGATIAVLGMGDIGGEYARKVKALGAACVIGLRRSQAPLPDFLDEQYTMDHLNEVLARADIVASVLPGGAATCRLFDAKRFAAMKKGAYFINCGRGSSVDQDALLEALRSGHLRGAAADVTDPEPLPADHPLYDEPNFVLTPHVAGNFWLQETFERIIGIAAYNLKAYLDGKGLANEIIR